MKAHQIKVALVGNMNNNFFTLMRFLRDLGIDCHLFLFSNEKSHFLPENDTWFIEKWEPYIHTLLFPSNYNSIRRFTLEKWEANFKDFDVVIGSGIVPGLFARVNKQLDIFKCYGADFYDLPFYKAFRHGGVVTTLKANLERFLGAGYQKRGLRESKHVFIFNLNKVMLETEKKLGLDNVSKISVPMVYAENVETQEWPEVYNSKIDQVESADFILMSHSRQIWKTLVNSSSIKRNDILIEGFASFVQETSYKTPKLILFEHGVDVEESRKLINQLGIEENVIWFPIMPRKYIVYLISKSNLGADQFYLGVWGGTTNEFLSQGVPVLNKVTVNKIEYESRTGTDFPPIISVHSPAEVNEILSDYEKHREKYLEIASRSKKWYDDFMGLGLAKHYVKIIEEIYSEKG